MRKRTHTILIGIAVTMLLFGCQPIQSLEPVSIEPVSIDAVSSTAPQSLPFAWPMPTLTEEQLREVRECDLETLATERYPETLAAEELLASYAPQNACDWAALTVAYSYREPSDGPMLPATQEAFTNAILANPGFIFTTTFFYGYFDAPAIVEPPGFSQEEITDVRIDYSWKGLGAPGADQMEFSVEIRQAITEPIVISTAITGTLTIDKATVQELAAALGNFVPVESEFDLLPCADNFPQWFVGLTFADGREAELSTRSNFMYIGGPWFMQRGDQLYMQLSPAFAVAVATLVDELGLTLGKPAGMTCSTQPVLDLAFP